MNKTNSATVKLTAKQQQVVNLMAAGWAMEVSRDSWGGRFKGRAVLRNGDKETQISRAIDTQLLAKDVIAVGEKTAFDSSLRVLTALGRQMATDVEKQAKPQTWWQVMKWSTDIRAETFAGSTPACLIHEDGRKTTKSGTERSWFSSREAAVEYLHKKLQGSVTSAERALESHQKVLAAFEKKEGIKC